MKTLIKNYLMVIALVLSHPVAFAMGKLPETVKRERFVYEKADLTALLLVIASLETDNGRNVGHITGEKTIYGISRSVWVQHTTVPWSRAGESPTLDKAVATSHLRWIISRIAKEGMSPRVEFVFAAWHYGLARAYMGSTDYAMRGGNLYYDLIKL